MLFLIFFVGYNSFFMQDLCFAQPSQDLQGCGEEGPSQAPRDMYSVWPVYGWQARLKASREYLSFFTICEWYFSGL